MRLQPTLTVCQGPSIAQKHRIPFFIFNDLRTLLQFSALFCNVFSPAILCFQYVTHSFALLEGEGGRRYGPGSTISNAAS
jgi:hypothetical protein